MQFTLTMACDSAAFSPAGDEIARILRHLAEHLDGAEAAEAPLENTLRDVNGNAVGKWALAD